MNEILHPYLDQFVVVYLDDIVIYSDTLEEHVVHLKKVFKILRENQLYVKREKCEFAQPKVHFLGHIISQGELRMDEAKKKGNPRVGSAYEGGRAAFISWTCELLSQVH